MRGRTRVVAAAALAVGVGVGLAGPSRAAPPTITWRGPTTETQPGQLVIAGTATDPDGNGIASVEVALAGPETKPDDPCRPNPSRANFTGPAGGPAGSSSATFELAVTFPCDGRYHVTASATTKEVVGDPEHGSGTEDVSIVIPPARTTGVKAALDGSRRSVRLSWAAAGEADLVEYDVARTRPGSDKATPFAVVPAGTTEVVDDIAGPGGTYRYAVVAVRGRPGAGVAPVAAPPSDEVSVQAADPPPNAPTTTAPPAGSVSFDDLRRQAAAGTAPAPAVPVAPPPTIDTGFAPTLPFDLPSTTTTVDLRPLSDRQPRAVAFEDRRARPSHDRAVVVPVAGALVLLALAAHGARLLSQT